MPEPKQEAEQLHIPDQLPPSALTAIGVRRAGEALAWGMIFILIDLIILFADDHSNGALPWK